MNPQQRHAALWILGLWILMIFGVAGWAVGTSIIQNLSPTSLAPNVASTVQSTQDPSLVLPLTFTIETNKEIYKIGEPVSATLFLKNAGDQGFWLLTWTVLNHRAAPTIARSVSFKITTSQGTEIPFMAFVSSFPKTNNSYRLLKASEVFSVTERLNPVYALSQPGQYFIQATFENDYLPPKEEPVWMGRIESNQVVITIEP